MARYRGHGYTLESQLSKPHCIYQWWTWRITGRPQNISIHKCPNCNEVGQYGPQHLMDECGPTAKMAMDVGIHARELFKFPTSESQLQKQIEFTSDMINRAEITSHRQKDVEHMPPCHHHGCQLHVNTTTQSAGQQ